VALVLCTGSDEFLMPAKWYWRKRVIGWCTPGRCCTKQDVIIRHGFVSMCALPGERNQRHLCCCFPLRSPE